MFAQRGKAHRVGIAQSGETVRAVRLSERKDCRSGETAGAERLPERRDSQSGEAA